MAEVEKTRAHDGATRTNHVRAARLHEIQAYILDNLRQQTLSIHGVASRHGLSAAYVRGLFAAEGTTFAEYLRQQRLAAAYLMLSDMRSADRSVSMIAFAVGFGSVTYFNRVFQNRYGMKPTQLRERQR